MTYDETVEALQTVFEVDINHEDEDFLRILPRAFEYANARIYREANFLNAVTSQTGILTANTRTVVLPTSVLWLDAINVITPVGAIANTSVRTQLERVSIVALDYFYPQASDTPGIPRKYAVIGPSPFTVRLAPEPDDAYTAEYIGRIRPAALSDTNQITYLATTYPELHMAACCVYLAGYQRDFGAQGEDPQRAQSWEAQYRTLLASAAMESMAMPIAMPGPMPGAA